ncbi:MAG: DUF1963 domain-containing protein [Oscillospiraceae bacterium]|nr:DUF1963 domain-containing protein [Oscillospiraceae bacterium]
MNHELFDLCREKYGKNAVYLTPASDAAASRTHLGGAPLLPADFEYPVYTGEGTDGLKTRPLSFLAQVDCAEIHALDRDALLPDRGILSFFYEQDTQCWGDEQEDAGCARAYWFEDVEALRETPLPDSLDAEYRLPLIPVQLQAASELPEHEEFGEEEIPELEQLTEEDGAYEEFVEVRSEYHGYPRIKLLGYADIIQNDMKSVCVKSTNPKFRITDWGGVTEAFRAEYWAERDDWMLLFQFDSLEYGDFSLVFGDWGRLYFWIRKSDLAKRDFSRIWMVLQCY